MPAQFSKSLIQPFRKNELVVGAGWRGFFAPYNIALGSGVASTLVGPTILDLQNSLPFNTNTPPTGWFDLGWIKGFKLTPKSKIGAVRSGYRGAIRTEYKGEVGEEFDFQFLEFTRMAFKLATGNVPFNLLYSTMPQTVGPLSASGALTVPLGASGYQAAGAGTTAGSPTLFVPSGSGAAFAVGNDVVCDIDYVANTTGYVGSAGIYVAPNQNITDLDFVRKTSDFVGRITSISTGAVAGQDGLVLSAPLVGGGSGNPGLTAPPSTAKVSRIIGYGPREGASFYSEWSAAFVLDTQDGAQCVIYYPHCAIMQFKDMGNWKLENAGTTDLQGYHLEATMEALAFDDPLDGETVVGYKMFIPRIGEDPAI